MHFTDTCQVVYKMSVHHSSLLTIVMDVEEGVRTITLATEVSLVVFDAQKLARIPHRLEGNHTWFFDMHLELG